MPKPVINIRGDKRFRLKKGEEFVDPGVDVDSGVLVTDNQVDTSEIGVYYVTYESSNSSGTTVEEREVVVTQDGVCGITIGSGRGSMRSFI